VGDWIGSQNMFKNPQWAFSFAVCFLCCYLIMPILLNIRPGGWARQVLISLSTWIKASFCDEMKSRQGRLYTRSVFVGLTTMS
jgi:hypothetical protein